jgi:hypothetical protein
MRNWAMRRQMEDEVFFLLINSLRCAAINV